MAHTRQSGAKTKQKPFSRRSNGQKPVAVIEDCPATTLTKTADDKGRVALGRQFANRAVIIETVSDTEIVIKLARVIPESEAWLYENPKALAAVRKGLTQARAGEVTAGPNVDADAALAAELEG
jgi:hypothetical protein